MKPLQIPQNLPVFYDEGGKLHPSHLATGPWYKGTQHGSAMMLLAALAAEQFPSEIERQVTRLTVDMMKAAPIAPIELQTMVRKGGKNMEVLDISILNEGQEFVRASAMRFRIDEVPVAERIKFKGDVPVLPEPLAESLFTEAAHREGFHHAIEIRIDVHANPAIMWLRLRQPVIGNQPATPLLRVAAAADWTYAVPSIAHRVVTGEGFNSQPYYGINPDTTINLHRPATGEWIGIQSNPTYDNLGVGTVMGQLFDQLGPIGYSTQSVLLRHRISS